MGRRRWGRRASPTALLALALAPNPVTAKGDAPEIVHVLARDYAVTVKAGAEGPLYTVRDLAGKPVVADASEAELARHHPELWQRLRSLLAGDGNGTRIEWAGE